MNFSLQVKIKEKYRRQYVFAGKVGRSDSFVSQVISGRKELEKKEKSKWAKALGCKVSDIFPEA